VAAYCEAVGLKVFNASSRTQLACFPRVDLDAALALLSEENGIMTTSEAGPGTIRVAIVGAGGMGSEHARAFADIAGVDVVGLCTRTTEKGRLFAAERGIPVVAETVRGLYEQTRADLVVVAVPELAIAAVMEAVTQFPWTV
jgi:ornithine cyclodeaminase/alanine dehydrogenase-like protein (mu-crystallin family)